MALLSELGSSLLSYVIHSYLPGAHQFVFSTYGEVRSYGEKAIKRIKVMSGSHEQLTNTNILPTVLAGNVNEVFNWISLRREHAQLEDQERNLLFPDTIMWEKGHEFAYLVFPLVELGDARQAYLDLLDYFKKVGSSDFEEKSLAFVLGIQYPLFHSTRHHRCFPRFCHRLTSNLFNRFKWPSRWTPAKSICGIWHFAIPCWAKSAPSSVRIIFPLNQSPPPRFLHQIHTADMSCVKITSCSMQSMTAGNGNSILTNSIDTYIVLREVISVFHLKKLTDEEARKNPTASAYNELVLHLRQKFYQIAQTRSYSVSDFLSDPLIWKAPIWEKCGSFGSPQNFYALCLRAAVSAKQHLAAPQRKLNANSVLRRTMPIVDPTGNMKTRIGRGLVLACSWVSHLPNFLPRERHSFTLKLRQIYQGAICSQVRCCRRRRRLGSWAVYCRGKSCLCPVMRINTWDCH